MLQHLCDIYHHGFQPADCKGNREGSFGFTSFSSGSQGKKGKCLKRLRDNLKVLNINTYSSD
jgi:hypothetical protein